MGNQTSIRVDYKLADGWHVFSSDQLPGLYVASPDAERAFHDVAKAIQLLLKLDEGIECEVRPEVSFEEFLARHRQEAFARPTLVLSEQRYAVYCR